MKTITWFGFVLAALSAAGEVIRTKPGQAAIFQCQTSNYRMLEWHHGGNRIVRVNGVSGQQSKAQDDIAKRSTASETTLKVVSVKKEDAGRFICKVDGKLQEHTLLVVSVSSSPSGVLQPGSTAELKCEVNGLNPKSSVKWKDPDGHQRESATIELKPVAVSHAGTWECLFTQDAVTYNESLTIKVKAPEKAPPLPSPESPNVVAQTTCNNCVTNPPPMGALLDLSWWVWVALGVGCLVVILLIVVVIVLCRRIRRRKRKYQTRQNGHQPLKPRQFCQCNRPTAAAKPQQGRRREKPLALPRQPLLME